MNNDCNNCICGRNSVSCHRDRSQPTLLGMYYSKHVEGKEGIRDPPTFALSFSFPCFFLSVLFCFWRRCPGFLNLDRTDSGAITGRGDPQTCFAQKSTPLSHPRPTICGSYPTTNRSSYSQAFNAASPLTTHHQPQLHTPLSALSVDSAILDLVDDCLLCPLCSLTPPLSLSPAKSAPKEIHSWKLPSIAWYRIHSCPSLSSLNIDGVPTYSVIDTFVIAAAPWKTSHALQILHLQLGIAGITCTTLKIFFTFAYPVGERERRSTHTSGRKRRRK